MTHFLFCVVLLWWQETSDGSSSDISEEECCVTLVERVLMDHRVAVLIFSDCVC